MSETLVHATSVAIAGRAVLLEGPSGSGKSDLALRLIDRGAVLVSDDYTVLTAVDGQLIASPPDRIAGLIEVRGVGIVALPHLEQAPVALFVTLGSDVERLPSPRERVVQGIDVPELSLAPFEESAPLKVELALQQPLQKAA